MPPRPRTTTTTPNAASAKKATTAKAVTPVKKTVATKTPAPTKVAAPTKSAAAKKVTATKVTPTKVTPPSKVAPTKATSAAAATKSAPAKKAAPSAAAQAPAKSAPAKKAPAKAAAAAVASTVAPVRPAPAKKTVAPRPTATYANDEKFLERQHQQLLAERVIYVEQAQNLKAEAESLVEEMEPGDIQFDEESGEGGTLTVDRERDLVLSAQAQLAVEDIDDALRKITRGRYGICEGCGELISKPRLEAMPFARLCIACKSGGLSRR